MLKNLIFSCCLFICPLAQSMLEAKLLIITHAYNRPDFITIQDQTFRAFVKDDYEFVVFNDASDEETSLAIQNTCADLNISCIPIPQDIHKGPYLPRMPWESYDHPCVRASNVFQYSLNNLGFDHDGLVMIIDSDMFLVDDLNVAEYMQDYDISALDQSRGPVHYLWSGLVFLNMQTLPNKKQLSFNCTTVEGHACDVGAETYYYIRNNPEARVKLIQGQAYVNDLINEDVSNLHPFMKLMIENDVPDSEFFMNYKIFHYRSGSNWNYKSAEYHLHKTQVLQDLVSKAINQ